MEREYESKIRDIIKSVVAKELKNDKENFQKMITKVVKDENKIYYNDFLLSFKKELNSLEKKFLTKQQIKDLMISAFIKQHKFMWEKSKFLTSYFNDL
jgi:hypothetical protein